MSCYDQVDIAERKMNVIDEFESYLISNDDDLFAFWQRHEASYSIMYSIACEIPITSATNTGVEHLFPSSGNAVTETRTRLSTQKVNKLIFIKTK